MLDALSGAHLFLDTLVDKHVGINCGTQRKHDTGYTRHGECRLERSQDAESEEEVEQQCAVSHHTGDEVVHQNHVDHKQHEGDDERGDTLLDRLCAESRTNHLFLNDAGRSGHTSRFQGVGKVFGVFDGEVTAD